MAKDSDYPVSIRQISSFKISCCTVHILWMETLEDSCNLIFEIHWYPPYAMHPDEGKFEEEHFTY